MTAALYVQRGGAYFGLDGVDPWDEARDARTYAGPHPPRVGKAAASRTPPAFRDVLLSIARAAGRRYDENLVACCRSCNSRKGARTPQAAGMVML